MPDPLLGTAVLLPSGERALVLSVEHEYDDGCTLRYLDGAYKGTETMRDTYAVRRYPIVARRVASDEEGQS
jgi:hypothetical protein